MTDVPGTPVAATSIESVPPVDCGPVPPTAETPFRVVVLVSGSGTLLQALIDEVHRAEGGSARPIEIVAVGADRPDIEGLRRAERADITPFVIAPRDYVDRGTWDRALADEIASYAPDLVVSAGFMRILGAEVLRRFTVINTHPALLPSFPGAHGVRDALAYGVKVTGTTCHLVDAGVDTGPIIEQRVVPIEPEDTEATLHERIKVEERAMLVGIVRRIADDALTVDGRCARIGP